MQTGAQLLVWAIVGLIGGSFAGMIAKGERRGFGVPHNLGLGLAGALIGGVLVRLFDLFPQLDRIAFSLRDVVSAVVGSLIVLVIMWLMARRHGARSH